MDRAGRRARSVLGARRNQNRAGSARGVPIRGPRRHRQKPWLRRARRPGPAVEREAAPGSAVGSRRVATALGRRVFPAGHLLPSGLDARRSIRSQSTAARPVPSGGRGRDQNRQLVVEQ